MLPAVCPAVAVHWLSLNVQQQTLGRPRVKITTDILKKNKKTKTPLVRNTRNNLPRLLRILQKYLSISKSIHSSKPGSSKCTSSSILYLFILQTGGRPLFLLFMLTKPTLLKPLSKLLPHLLAIRHGNDTFIYW